jgi:hypothetical protein
MSPLRELLLFALALLALVVLSGRVSRQVQILALRVTGSEQAAYMAYYLLFLPGIVLHELSHVVMASLLGLRVGSVSLGPRRRNKTSIELGSVTISRSDAVRESLVGLAPFLAGTAALTLICYYVFDIGAMAEALRQDGWSAALRNMAGFWRVPDFGVWAYFIFVVSNAMMPSPSDRRPWLLAGLYLALALGLFFLVVGMPVLPDGLRYSAAALFQALTLAFLFTLIVDLAVAVLFWAADLAVAALHRR